MISYHKNRDNGSIDYNLGKACAREIKIRLEKEIHGFELNRVLDLGCGKGNFVKGCLENGIHALGIDIRDGIYKGESNFVRGDIRRCPFPDNSFDLVFNNLFFEDMVDLQGADELDINSVFREISRVLREPGLVFNFRSSSFPVEDPKDRFRLMSGNKMNMDRIYQKIF